MKKNTNISSKTTAINLDDEIALYIDSLDRKEITKNSYKTILIQYSKYLKKHNLVQPTKRDVISYKEYLLKKVGSATVQKTIVVLRGFYKYLCMSNKYDDIMYGIRGVKIEKTFKRNSLDVDEIFALLKEAKEESNKSIIHYRNYVMISLMLTTGLRTIEIIRADVSDIMIHKDKCRLYIQGKGHDDKDEYVKLSPEIYELLIEYLKRRNDEFEPLFITHKNSSGERLTTRTVRGVVKDLLRAIDIDDKRYSAHSLRHSLATILIKEANGTLEEAQQILRHKDISTTEIYNHALTRETNNGEIKVSNILFRKDGNNNG